MNFQEIKTKQWLKPAAYGVGAIAGVVAIGGGIWFAMHPNAAGQGAETVTVEKSNPKQGQGIGDTRPEARPEAWKELDKPNKEPKPDNEPEQEATTTTPPTNAGAAGDGPISFESDEAEVVENEFETPVLETGNRVPGWRVTAYGHRAGSLPMQPAWSWNQTRIGVDDELLLEDDVSAGFRDTTGELATWNTGPGGGLTLQSGAELATLPKTTESAGGVDELDALMGSLDSGELDTKEATRPYVKASGYTIYSISAEGRIEIDEPGVYEFRVLSGGEEIDIGEEHKSRGRSYYRGQQQMALTVAGSTVFGGPATRTRSDFFSKYMIPGSVKLSEGGYDVSFRIAPKIKNNEKSMMPLSVEYRRQGSGWKPIAADMTSPEVLENKKKTAPVLIDKISHATQYNGTCDLKVLPDSFVNEEDVDLTKRGRGPVQLPGCELTTIRTSYDAQKAGDHYVMPMITKDCLVSMSYVDGNTSAADQIIPGPDVSDLGWNGSRNAYANPVAHIPVSKPGILEIETRIMCREDAQADLYFKNPQNPRMVPWP